MHRPSDPPPDPPGVSLLKPVKGCDATTADSLESWLIQQYAGPVQVLFGVDSTDHSVAAVVRQLMAKHPSVDAQCVVCSPAAGANGKVAKLVQLLPLARHPVLVVSDADVRVLPGLLSAVTAELSKPGVGLVNCFYRLANPSTLAMRWEAVAINADFWSQVLQSLALKPMDFALGAVMALRRETLDHIGGFVTLTEFLADDYQLGNRVASSGRAVRLCRLVVECWSGPMGWKEVWNHQLRWARTIRVSRPQAYFLSILSNPTLWPLLWLFLRPGLVSGIFAAVCVVFRLFSAWDLQRRLAGGARVPNVAWLAPFKDLAQIALWLGAFAGNTIRWRGERMRLRKDGTLEPCRPRIR